MQRGNQVGVATSSGCAGWLLEAGSCKEWGISLVSDLTLLQPWTLGLSSLRSALEAAG